MKAGKPKAGFYQIRNMPKRLSKAIRVAAALAEVPIWKWVVRELTKSVRAAGIVIDEEDVDAESKRG